jgi:predicted nucleic acid-binding protein
MILIDSSCWIEYLRPKGDARVARAVAEALARGDAAICPIVRVEILGFISRDKEYEQVCAVFEAAISLEIGASAYERAIALGRALRRRGETAPTTDLLVAAAALEHEAMLLHADRHFERISTVSSLRQRRA